MMIRQISIYFLATILVLPVFPIEIAQASKLDRYESQLDDKESELKVKKRELSTKKSNLERAEGEVADLKRESKKLENTIDDIGALPLAQARFELSYDSLEKFKSAEAILTEEEEKKRKIKNLLEEEKDSIDDDIRRKSLEISKLKSDIEELEDDDIEDLEKDIKKLSHRIDDEIEKEDCEDCGRRRGSSFAEGLLAFTPLLLGGLGAYYGIKNQRSDYRDYRNSMNELGLPSYPPQGYGGVLGATLGPAIYASAAMSGNGHLIMGRGPYFNGSASASARVGGGVHIGGTAFIGGFGGGFGGGHVNGCGFGGGFGGGYYSGFVNASGCDSNNYGGGYGGGYGRGGGPGGYFPPHGSRFPGGPYGGGPYGGGPYGGGREFWPGQGNIPPGPGFPGPGNTYGGAFSGHNPSGWGGLNNYNLYYEQMQHQADFYYDYQQRQLSSYYESKVRTAEWSLEQAQYQYDTAIDSLNRTGDYGYGRSGTSYRGNRGGSNPRDNRRGGSSYLGRGETNYRGSRYRDSRYRDSRYRDSRYRDSRYRGGSNNEYRGRNSGVPRR